MAPLDREDIAAIEAGHPDACWYTLKATLEERLEHYRSRTPACEYYPADIAGYDFEAKPIPKSAEAKLALIDAAMAELDLDKRDSMEDTLNRIMDILEPPFKTEEDAKHDMAMDAADPEMGGWEPRS